MTLFVSSRSDGLAARPGGLEIVVEVGDETAFEIFQARGVARHVPFFWEENEIVGFLGRGEGDDQAGSVT